MIRISNNVHRKTEEFQDWLYIVKQSQNIKQNRTKPSKKTFPMLLWSLFCVGYNSWAWCLLWRMIHAHSYSPLDKTDFVLMQITHCLWWRWQKDWPTSHILSSSPVAMRMSPPSSLPGASQLWRVLCIFSDWTHTRQPSAIYALRAPYQLVYAAWLVAQCLRDLRDPG